MCKRLTRTQPGDREANGVNVSKKHSLVFRNARLQDIASFAETYSKPGIRAKTITQSKEVWQSKRALDQPGLVLAACLREQSVSKL